MVAAVGLVIGPVLGGALVAIAWPWVFWFNVPFALARLAVGAARARGALGPESRSAASTSSASTTYVVGLTGLVLALSKGGLSGWNELARDRAGSRSRSCSSPSSCSSSTAAARRCSISPSSQDRLFSAASAAAFLNGLSRFALMFLFVFYFQGPQGQSPIMAGLELAPMAIGMLIASPLAGAYADRRGSRGLAALGMLVSAVGLAGMTMLQAHTAYVWSAVWLLARRASARACSTARTPRR